MALGSGSSSTKRMRRAMPRLAALHLLDGVAGAVDVVVPGHGPVGGADQGRR
jgi:hypothetical protein